MKAVFFARVADPRVLSRNEFYAVDLRILEDLGIDVEVVTSPLRITRADLYFVWWWTWAFAPVLRAKLAGKPVIIVGAFDHVMSDGSLQAYPKRNALHKALIKFALRAADANVVDSRDQYAYLRDHFSVARLRYSPHVLDTNQYVPLDIDRGNTAVSICWMNSGNAKRKCIPELIRGFVIVHRDFPELRLAICGEQGSDFPELSQLVRDLEAEEYISFPGVVSKEDKITLLQQCPVYLQPTRAEGFGVAILEAMSCGAPIVTSPVGAVPEVAGDSVVMVDGTDVESIARATIDLLRDQDRRESLGKRARDRAVELFSYNRRKTDIERVIQEVMSSTPSTGTQATQA